MIKIPYVPFSQLRPTDTGTRYRDPKELEKLKRRELLKKAALRVQQRQETQS